MNNKLFNGERILVVAAHPDDEVLGVGGTLHCLVKRHDCEARAVILGEGITSRGEERDPDIWQKELDCHRKNISKATEYIGYASTGVYDFPDNRFDSVDLLDLVKQVESEIDNFKPDVIFTHHPRDLNIDHRRSCEAVMTSTRPLPGEPARTIMAFETPSSTEWQLAEPHDAFLPNFFVSLTKEDVVAKQNAIEAYENERRDYPHPRSSKSLEILAQRWGTVIGVEFAEAFRVLRWVLKE